MSDTANVSDIVIASTRLNGCDLFREGKICVKFKTKVTNEQSVGIKRGIDGRKREGLVIIDIC